jgi:magnesium transporter
MNREHDQGSDDDLTMEQVEQKNLVIMRELLIEAEDEDIISELDTLHHVDIALLLMDLEDNERNRLFTLLTRQQAAGVFSEIDVDLFEELFALLKREQKVAILDLMGQDDIVDILGEVSENLRNRILALLDEDVHEEVVALLDYHEETAGGIMTKDYVDINARMTMGQAIDHLRSTAPDAETIYYVYVVDDEERLVGIVSLRELLIAKPETFVDQVMNTSVISVYVDQDQEDVARVVSKYGLLAVPVLDREDRLIGIVTVDDVIDVLEEEATEDILRFAGTNEDELEHYEDHVLLGIFYSIRARLPWLIVTIFGGLFSAYVVGQFEEALKADQAIALFMPLLAGMGGNVGTQSSTLTVRNIAVNNIQGKAVWRTLFHEITVGFSVGLVCSIIVGILSFVMRGRMMLSVIVGISMWMNILTAASIGTIVPLVFKRVGVDPAVASAPFITTTIDITGLTIYFTLATMLMTKLL